MRNNRPFLLLALLTAFPPVSTDMYLPAIPLLQKTWHQPFSVVNLTMVAFFGTYCTGLLLYGPLSDRFGRRKPLLAGIGLYILACMLCAVSTNIIALIIFRMLQALGSASASVIAMAITKDVYEGSERERILAYIAVIMALAPMAGPVLGSWTLIWLSWRWVFIIQGLVGIIAGIGVIRMPETLETRSASGFRQTAGIYLELMRNKRFILVALIMSLIGLPHFAFIGGSSDIYINVLGLSEQTFGYFFSMNAFALMAGSFACSQLLRRMHSTPLMTIGFAGIMAAGVAMFYHWLPGPWRLSLPMAFASFCFGLSRPPSNSLILEQVDRHAGAASSIMIFIYFMLGAFSMWLISQEWSDKIRFIGILGVICGGLTLLFWILMQKRDAGRTLLNQA